MSWVTKTLKFSRQTSLLQKLDSTVAKVDESADSDKDGSSTDFKSSEGSTRVPHPLLRKPVKETIKESLQQQRTE